MKKLLSKNKKFLAVSLTVFFILQPIVPVFPLITNKAQEIDSYSVSEEVPVVEQVDVNSEEGVIDEDVTSPTTETVNQTDTGEILEGVSDSKIPEETQQLESIPDWYSGESNSYATSSNVKVGVRYEFPLNKDVSVTFTKLPEPSGILTIRELTLSAEQIESLGTYGNKAYDITTSMQDGTFEYNLTLPTFGATNADIKYAESLSELNDASQSVDAYVNYNGEFQADSLNHFTVFVPVANPFAPPANTQEGVIDNGDPEFSVTGTGSGTSTGACALTGYLSDNHFGNPGSSANFTWAFDNIPQDGKYRVFAHFIRHSNRTNAAPYTINYEGGSTTVFVDQTNGSATCVSSGFVEIGTSAGYDFLAGNTYNISLASVASGYVSADAVKLVYVDSAPVVTAVDSTTLDDSYGLGQVINFTVKFSENVTVTGTPRIELLTGGFANYVSGSGTDTLVFDYTISSNEESLDLDYALASVIDLNSGQITDISTNAADLTLPASGSFASSHDIVVDAVNPTIDNIEVYNSLVSGSNIISDLTYSNGSNVVVGGSSVLICADFTDNGVLTDIGASVSGTYNFDDSNFNPFPTNNGTLVQVAEGTYCLSFDTVNGNGNLVPAGLADGDYDIVFTAKDLGGALTSGSQNMESVNVTLTLDNTKPVITFNDDVNASSNQVDTVNVSISDTNILSYEYGFSVDNVCDALDTYGYSFTSGSDITFNTDTENGNYLCIKAIDKAGNENYASSSESFNIDVTKPVVTNVRANTSYTSGVTTYVRGNGVFGISGGFNVLADVTDNTGIDSLSCEYTLDGGSNWISTNAEYLPAFNRCRFLNVVATDGLVMDINVRVKDLAGNSNEGTQITRVADSVNPVASGMVISPDTGSFTSANPTIFATITDSVSPIYDCQFRTKTPTTAWSAWTNVDTFVTTGPNSADCSTTLSGLVDGENYSFQIRGRDFVRHSGNAVMLTRTIDDQIPFADPSSFSSNPAINTPTFDNTVDVSWVNSGLDAASGVDGYSYSFTTNSSDIPDQVKDLEESDSNASSAVLADGVWYFHIITADNVGNWTSTAHYGPFVIDTMVPTLQSFSSTTANGTYGPGSVIDIVANYDENLDLGSSLVVTLDNGVTVTLNSVSANTISGTYVVGSTGSGEDSLDLTVASIVSSNVSDLALNNQSSTTLPSVNLGDSKDIVIDVTAPNAPTPLSPVDGYETKGVAFTQTWTSETDAVSYFYESCRVDTGDLGAICTDIRFTNSYSGTSKSVGAGQPNGRFWWRLKAVDAYGNESEFGENFMMIIDNSAPVVTLNTYSPDPTNDGTPTFTGSVTDMPVIASDDYPSGVNKVEYRVLNSSDSSVVVDWTDAIADDLAFDGTTENFNFTPSLTDGTYVIEVRSVDDAGNVSLVVSDTLTVDLTKPSIDDLSDIVVKEGDSLPSITVNANDTNDLSSVCIEIVSSPIGSFPNFCIPDDGSVNVSYTWDLTSLFTTFTGNSLIDTSIYAEGDYVINYYAIDAASNKSDLFDLKLTIENVKPVVSLSSDQTIDEGTAATFTGSFTDPSSNDSGDGIFDDASWNAIINYGEGSDIDLGTFTNPGSITIPDHTYVFNGTYTVTLSVCESDTTANPDSEAMCTTDTVTVIVNDLVPQVTINGVTNFSTSVGTGTVVNITANGSGGNTPYTYNWGGVCSFFSGQTGTVSTSVPGTYNCSVTITDVDSDTSNTATATITVTSPAPANQVPQAFIAASPSTTVTTPTQITLSAIVLGGDLPIASYTWGGACSGNGTTTTVPTAPGTYICTLTVVDANGDASSNPGSSLTLVVNPNNVGAGGGNVQGVNTTNDNDDTDLEVVSNPTDSETPQILGEDDTATCEAEFSISGKVVDKDGFGMQGVSLEVIQSGNLIKTLVTDSNGNYTVSLCPGTYEIKLKESTLDEKYELVSDASVSKVLGEFNIQNVDFEVDEKSEFNMLFVIIPLVLLAILLLLLFATRSRKENN